MAGDYEMPCFHPVVAYQSASGEIVFAERGDLVRTLTLPCGQCIGCRIERSRQWTVRCVHEAQLYAPENAFVTLTYDDDHVPYRNNLCYRDFQLFMKRLRKELEPRVVRFFACGEYGPENGRPHFHALIFNWGFHGDRKYWKKSPAGKAIYRSAQLERLWPFGFASVGNVSADSAGYIARYCIKKVNGDLARAHYSRVDETTGEVFQLEPEFLRMSLKPGIGRDWFDLYWKDLSRDFVVIDGKKVSLPRYYDKLYAERDGVASEQMKDARTLRAHDPKVFADNTDARLAVKQICAADAANPLKKERF